MRITQCCRSIPVSVGGTIGPPVPLTPYEADDVVRLVDQRPSLRGGEDSGINKGIDPVDEGAKPIEGGLDSIIWLDSPRNLPPFRKPLPCGPPTFGLAAILGRVG
jgi:hypothetical protein